MIQLQELVVVRFLLAWGLSEFTLALCTFINPIFCPLFLKETSQEEGGCPDRTQQSIILPSTPGAGAGAVVGGASTAGAVASVTGAATGAAAAGAGGAASVEDSPGVEVGSSVAFLLLFLRPRMERPMFFRRSETPGGCCAHTG